MTNSSVLTHAVERLSTATSLEAVTGIVAEAARSIAGADGATFVLRDDGKCFYADEDAISPLWKGKRFPLETCISGWCMLHREVVTIRDIYEDDRIPKDAYRPTFVKSLCMIPIRQEDPVGAIGSYWSEDHQPSPDEVKLLQILANSSATALENLELRRDLERRNRERDTFFKRHEELEFQLHSLAHDLKSPLATMMGFAELLQSRLQKAPEEKNLQYVASILSVGERLNRQIEKILTLYRLSSSKIQKQALDLAPLAGEIVRGLKAQDPARPVEVEIGAGLKADADPDLIRLALENLLANAFKYSRKKPSTWLRFDRDPGAESAAECAFVIEDRGAGFDDAQAERLFRPFVRLHRDSEFQGTGLGLASVARIVELHGGRVRAEGENGQGARFFFTLPRS